MLDVQTAVENTERFLQKLLNEKMVVKEMGRITKFVLRIKKNITAELNVV